MPRLFPEDLGIVALRGQTASRRLSAVARELVRSCRVRARRVKTQQASSETVRHRTVSQGVAGPNPVSPTTVSPTEGPADSTGHVHKQHWPRLVRNPLDTPAHRPPRALR